ncbi:hypothetical protein TNCV_3045411 [Trichonephila clavipes]|nr:hypothetical protein TNCV_3045411 [Trichonephila clavipes]
MQLGWLMGECHESSYKRCRRCKISDLWQRDCTSSLADQNHTGVAASAKAKWRIINLLDDIWMLTRGRIIGKLEEGRSVTSVPAEFELLTASFHDFGDNFKPSQEHRGSVVVFEEPHPRMTGTLSYRPEKIGGRREKSLDTRHRRLDDQISRFYRSQKTAQKLVMLHDALYDCVALTPASGERRSLCAGNTGTERR